MVSLRFFGGVGEIGGNKILLEDGDARVWLDFGRSFDCGAEYYTGYLQPRPIAGLKDLLEFDLLPRVEGLYAEDMLTDTEIRYSDPQFDGVLITHAHGDHIGHLGYIDPQVRVYTGAGTKLFMEATEETSAGGRLGDHQYRGFRTGDTLNVGGLEVRPIHVDHSIPGAYGFIIQTSEGAIAYTGDLRAHGPKAEMTEDFLKAATESKPVALITEGTRMAPVDRRRNLTERQVYEGVLEVCRRQGNRGRLVLYTHGPRDTDRFRTFYNAASESGRKIVVSPKTAYLLSKLVMDRHLDLPDPQKDDSLAVYYRRKRSGNYDERDYYFWERPFLDKIVTPGDLKWDPGAYMVNIGFSELTELIDIRPEPGTPFVYSMSEHFSEEDVEGQVLQNWLSHFGLEHIQLHASGHMARGELADALTRIKPGRVFPVHTEHPELFEGLHGRVTQPVKGETYRL